MQRPSPSAEPFAALSLPELEEAAGELVRRIAVALRALGEAGADDAPAGDQSERGSDGTPRLQVAQLAALLELAAASLAAAEAARPGALGSKAAPAASDAAGAAQTKALAMGVMYAAPTVDSLLSRLEQDRRLLASLTRGLEPRLDERHATPLGTIELRALVAEIAIAEPARTAQALERVGSARREAELAAAEAATETERC